MEGAEPLILFRPLVRFGGPGKGMSAVVLLVATGNWSRV